VLRSEIFPANGKLSIGGIALPLALGSSPGMEDKSPIVEQLQEQGSFFTSTPPLNQPELDTDNSRDCHFSNHLLAATFLGEEVWCASESFMYTSMKTKPKAAERLTAAHMMPQSVDSSTFTAYLKSCHRKKKY